MATIEEFKEASVFNMDSLRTHLPKKRGLSKFFTGKSQSFTCIADAKCVADLRKPENHQSKKRKKQSDIPEGQFLLPISCRSVLSSSPCPPCIDV